MGNFENYKKEVILAYQKKKNEEDLSPNLILHTPARLKRECLDVFPSRYLEKDEHTFTALFKKGNNPADYLKMIKNANPDIFRPLNNFLTRNTNSGTNERNVELLAWLINYEYRPYRSEIEKPTPPEPTPPKPTPPEPTPPSPPDPKKEKPTEIPHKFNKTIAAFSGVLVILLASYLFYKWDRPQCMYWNGDHFELIDCEKKLYGTPVLKIDTARFDHLQKIRDIKSITRNDIGRVHYSKTNGKVEFYTIGGENPADTTKRLLPLTEYMFEKYLAPNEEK